MVSLAVTVATMVKLAPLAVMLVRGGGALLLLAPVGGPGGRRGNEGEVGPARRDAGEGGAGLVVVGAVCCADANRIEVDAQAAVGKDRVAGKDVADGPRRLHDYAGAGVEGDHIRLIAAGPANDIIDRADGQG